MVNWMKKVAEGDSELTIDERNLLSVAFKNVVGARRASWRVVASVKEKEESKGNTKHTEKINEYRSQIENELATICKDIIHILEHSLIQKATDSEAKVFYYKM